MTFWNNGPHFYCLLWLTSSKSAFIMPGNYHHACEVLKFNIKLSFQSLIDRMYRYAFWHTGYHASLHNSLKRISSSNPAHTVVRFTMVVISKNDSGKK